MIAPTSKPTARTFRLNSLKRFSHILAERPVFPVFSKTVNSIMVAPDAANRLTASAYRGSTNSDL